MKHRNWLLTILFAVTLGLTACGGGGGSDDDGNGGNGGNSGYNGKTGPATINADNEDDLTLASVSGLRIALSRENIPSASSSGGRPGARLLAERLAAKKYSGSIDELCETGSVTTSGPDGSAGTTGAGSDGSAGTTGAGTVTWVFDNCTYTNGDDHYTLDGTEIIEYREDHSFTVTVRDFTVTINEESQTLNYVMECNQDPGYLSCTLTSEGEGLDERVYQVTDIDFRDLSDGIVSGSMKIYDPDHGYVNVDFQDVAYETCPTYGIPESGTISITDEDGTILEVSFNGCDSFTVTDNGTSRTYQWADLLGGG